MTKRIGVIGLGHWGPNLARNFHALGTLAALCDSRPDILAKFSAQYPQARSFSDATQLLADPSLDAVAIATPVATHADMVTRSVAAGKDIFVEKPLCLTAAEARRLGDAARQRDRILMVGHLLLYHPAFLALKAVIDSGRLGALRYIYSNRLSLGKIRREESALWSFAPHDVSMILALTGQMPVRAMTNGGTWLFPDVADSTLSYLTFKDGVQAHVFVSWLHPYKDHRLVVIGSEGMATFHDSAPPGEKLLLYRHAIGWDGELANVTKAQAEPIIFEPGEPLALECAHFIDCIERRSRPRSDVEESVRVLAVLDACQRSLGNGMPVSLGENS